MSANYSDCVKLCRELVQRPSVTPDDHGCQELIAQRLQMALIIYGLVTALMTPW